MKLYEMAVEETDVEQVAVDILDELDGAELTQQEIADELDNCSTFELRMAVSELVDRGDIMFSEGKLKRR